MYVLRVRRVCLGSFPRREDTQRILSAPLCDHEPFGRQGETNTTTKTLRSHSIGEIDSLVDHPSSS